MSSNFRLLFFLRENFTDPSREAEWNAWANRIHIPEVLERIGSDGLGARYKIERGPVCVGWDGPTRVYKYLHVYELTDSQQEIESALRPAPEHSRLGYEIRGRPIGDMVEVVRVLYRRIKGVFDFPPLVCVTRLNWLEPEEEGEFHKFYQEVVFPAALGQPGFVRGALYVAEEDPTYIGWQGPSRAYKYLVLYELENTESAIVSALESELKLSSVGRRWLGRGSPVKAVNEVRAIYRLITKTRAKEASDEKF